MKSEFGSGFIYNLILFAKHWYMYVENKEKFNRINKEKQLHMSPSSHAAQLFFYGAQDHLQELLIPKRYKGTEIEKKTRIFLDFCAERRLPMIPVNEKDFEKAFKMLEEIAMLIDKDLGVKDIEATWE